MVSVNSDPIPSISYKDVNVSSIRLLRSSKNPKDPNSPQKITHLEVNGDTIAHSDRFLTSMCAIYGFAPSIFNYFTPDEVLSRIVEKKKSESVIRLAIEDNGTRKRALGVSKPTKPLLRVNALEDLLTRNGMSIKDASYHDGVVTTWHEPRLAYNFKVAGDDYASKYVIETPIDGYGVPSAYLALIREVCTNGAIGYTKAFRSQASLGKNEADAFHSMVRFTEAFSNEEGFAALRERLESALTSPVSLEEYHQVYKILTGDVMKSLHTNDSGKPVPASESSIGNRLSGLCGSLAVYGIANFDALTQKRRRVIPTTTKMYDLINFVTEIATHQANVEQARKLQGWVGTTITGEYDLEGTLASADDPVDLFFKQDEEAKN